MNVCFETFGCRLNLAEALENEAMALVLGHKIVKAHAEADIIIVRGCSVTARAQRDCENAIAHLKRHYPNKRIVVTGCLPGAEKGLKFLKAKASDKQSVNRLIEHPNNPLQDSAVQDSTSALQPTFPVPTRTARAYLKVQDGCAGMCTFCIVPKFRGSSVSENFEAVMDKAKRFIEAGYHEIVVTGCNLALYASGGKRLPDLIAALAALDPACRIRLGSLEPWGCADEVVDVLSEHENICRFLHIPVQSGSDRILKLMNRPYLVKDVERITKKAITLMPLISLGCDLIVGFPGESENDFILTKNLLTRLSFSNAHIFPYSERPGTPATKLPGVIQRHIRSHRAHLLGDIAKANRNRFAHRFLGKEVAVIIESHDTQPKGWTSEYLWFEGPIRATTTGTANRKQLIRYIVRSTSDGVLHGVPINHGR